MILKELNLISFGKFQNKRLSLGSGLNIIFGENESGKTTIHRFIDGMFYGFLRPYAKRRIYTDEYYKYRPWNGGQYTGVLKFSKDGKEYRIERDFDNGEVNVYDELVGENITAKIDAKTKVKIDIPGMHFFDFNTMVYKNTISIEQLGSRVDAKLSAEIKDKLANISQSLDDEISVKDCISDLDKELGRIGTYKAPTKPYGQSILIHSELLKKKKLALERQEEYNNTLEAFNSLKNEIYAKEKQIIELEKLIKRAKIINKRKVYENALNLKKEIESINIKIDRLKPYSNISSEDYEKGLVLKNQIDSLEKTIEALVLKIEDTTGRLDNKSIEKQRDRLTFLEAQVNDLKMKSKNIKTKGNICIIISLLFLLSILFKPLLGVFALPFIALFFVSKMLNGKLLKELEGSNEEIRDIQSKNALMEYRLNELKELEDELKGKEIERKQLIDELGELNNRNLSNTLEDFRKGLDQKRTYEDSLLNRDGKIALMNGMLGDIALDELRAQLLEYDDEYLRGEDIDIDDAMDRLRIFKESLSEAKESYSRLEERLNGLNQDVKNLIHIEEEINRINGTISYYENRIKSIELAKTTIERISQEIHSQFAPKINQQISLLINMISNEKYQEAKVNDELNIVIENPATKELINIDSLSGGTIDQLYFALRFSIINSMKGNNLPLVLDDCFIQYDDERLKNILMYLGSMSDNRQILLFTCHSRENRIMNDLGFKYNKIILN